MGKKNVSSVVSGLGLGLGILEGLVAAIREEGGTDEDIHRLGREEGRATLKAMAKLIVVRKDADAYPVTVDYDQSLADMIAAGNYDYTNPDFRAEHFPATEKGTAAVELVLVHLDREVTMAEVEQELAARGLKPATLPQLLALGAEHQDLQRKFPLVASGSSWVGPGGVRGVPYLAWDGDERGLGLNWDDPANRWHRIYRFVAVRFLLRKVQS